MGWLAGSQWPQSRRDSEGDKNLGRAHNTNGPTVNYVRFPIVDQWIDYFLVLGLPSARLNRRNRAEPQLSEHSPGGGRGGDMQFLRGGLGGGSGGGGGMAWEVVKRHFSRKRAVDIRRINPKVPKEEAVAISGRLLQILADHGPLTIANTWNHAKDAAIEGLNSKTHMKVLLKWMWGRQIIKLTCTQAGNTKKFLYSPFTTDANSEAAAEELTPEQQQQQQQQQPKKGWKGKHPKYKAQAKKQQSTAS